MAARKKERKKERKRKISSNPKVTGCERIKMCLRKPTVQVFYVPFCTAKGTANLFPDPNFFLSPDSHTVDVKIISAPMRARSKALIRTSKFQKTDGACFLLQVWFVELWPQREVGEKERRVTLIWTIFFGHLAAKKLMAEV